MGLGSRRRARMILIEVLCSIFEYVNGTIENW
jgi:hypothetical protein